jgi:quercetin dioxygenase-like cupin family protein
MFKIPKPTARRRNGVLNSAGATPMLARRRVLLALGAAAFPVGRMGWAQPSQTTPKLTQVLKADLLGQDHKVEETVVNVLEMAPAVAAPWHMHPGAQEIVFVLEGDLTVEIDGRRPQQLKTGGIILIPAETPHLVRNNGITIARALVTHSRADKEKPFLVALKQPT